MSHKDLFLHLNSSANNKQTIKVVKRLLNDLRYL